MTTNFWIWQCEDLGNLRSRCLFWNLVLLPLESWKTGELFKERCGGRTNCIFKLWVVVLRHFQYPLTEVHRSLLGSLSEEKLNSILLPKDRRWRSDMQLINGSPRLQNSKCAEGGGRSYSLKFYAFGLQWCCPKYQNIFLPLATVRMQLALLQFAILVHSLEIRDSFS